MGSMKFKRPGSLLILRAKNIHPVRFNALCRYVALLLSRGILALLKPDDALQVHLKRCFHRL